MGAYVLSKLPTSVRDQIKDKVAERIESITEDLLTPVDHDAEEELQCCRNMNNAVENAVIDQEEEEVAEQLVAVVEATADPAVRKRRNGRMSLIYASNCTMYKIKVLLVVQ